VDAAELKHMLTFKQSYRSASKRRERGSFLVESLIAMVVLAVGLGGLSTLLIASLYTNHRSSQDTTSTMVAEHVLEQISAQPANSATALSVTDCAGTAWSISTQGHAVGTGSGGSYGGDGANLTSGGVVDWAQAYANVPAGYGMQYVDCGSGGNRTVYDVRWNMITMSSYARMAIISARPSGSPANGGLRFVMPANLRTIGGL
jgi:type II secretory pathway pseudopilin PulG